MKGDSVISAIKLVGVVGAGSPVLQLFNEYIRQPVWGVPVTVIGAAAAGAALSLFFGDPIPTRKQLFGQVIAATMFGAGAAVMLADGMDWDWATKNISMFAMFAAAMIRWFLPTIIDRGKQLIKEFKLPFINKRNEGEEK